ncbi:MAG: hypothetical protein K5695_07015 [Oscillospiraceae bacterium]|nr:hypothetical protein [Oscillospiraceae bacterium]
MKMREIILDFTSLLDVIMIILFFFILNYRQEMKTRTEQAEQTAAQAVAAAEQQTAEAEALMQEAEGALAAMEGSAQADNIREMVAFGNAENINIYLVTEPEGWRLDVYKGEAFVNSVTDRKSDRIGWELTQIFQSEGYAPDATMLCVFSYNGRAGQTEDAYNIVMEAFSQIKTGNKRFFYTVVDTSVTQP